MSTILQKVGQQVFEVLDTTSYSINKHVQFKSMTQDCFAKIWKRWVEDLQQSGIATKLHLSQIDR